MKRRKNERPKKRGTDVTVTSDIAAAQRDEGEALTRSAMMERKVGKRRDEGVMGFVPMRHIKH